MDSTSMEISLIGLFVQGGFAALCGFMVYTKERKERRSDERRDIEWSEHNRVIAEKDRYIRELVESSRDLVLKSIHAQDQSTEVMKRILAVIERCNK